MKITKSDFKRVNKNSHIPTLGTELVAGADLYACLEQPVCGAAGTTEFIPTGIAMSIPEGLVGLIYARSGMACKKGLAPANKVGVFLTSMIRWLSEPRNRIFKFLRSSINGPSIKTSI